MVQPLIYEKRIVAFLDILGFSSMVDDSKVDTPLRLKLKRATEIIYESTHTNETGRCVSTFSDSAVISYPLNRESSLFCLLIDIIHLQLKLGAIGIFIRGGISIGDCFHDGNLIFGPAMNESYQFEHEVAKWPRVVISEDTLKKGIKVTKEHSPNGVDFYSNEIMSLLKRDNYQDSIPELIDDRDDGIMYFVDFLSQSQELTIHGDEYLSWLRGIRVALVEGLNRYSSARENFKDRFSHSDRDRVFKKFRWLLEYWNSVLDDENTVFPVPDIDKENKKKFYSLYKELKIKRRYPYS